MTSNDNQQYLTVEMFNSKMETFLTQIRLDNEKLRSELRSELQTGFATLHNELQGVRTNVKVNSAKIEMLQHTFYWGFGIMTAVIAFIAFFVPFFRLERKEKKQEQQIISEEKVQSMISQALSDFRLEGK